MLLTIAISVVLSLALSAVLLRNYECVMQKRFMEIYKILDSLLERIR